MLEQTLIVLTIIGIVWYMIIIESQYKTIITLKAENESMKQYVKDMLNKLTNEGNK